MSLLQMSFSGALMILATAAIRAAAVNRLPKSTFLALWGAAVLRLLVPFSFPSAFSAYSLPGRLAPAAGTPAAASAALTQAPAPAAATGSMAAGPLDPWAGLWAAGALLCAAYFLIAYRKCLRAFAASLPVENACARQWLGAQRLFRTVEIRQSDRISVPLTYGVFRPVILMPKTVDWEDSDTIPYVLAHEFLHIRRFDAVTKMVLAGVLCVHWFNPAVWLLYVLANRDLELSCDEAVLRQFGEHKKAAYAMALLRMEETRCGPAPLCSGFSKNAIEERIVAIMKTKKTTLPALAAAVVLVAGVTVAFATSAEAAGDSARPGAKDAADTMGEASDVLSYVDAQDGTAYYSFDGGKTFQPLTEEAYEALSPRVEWWTYDEYEAWLENEKVQLQGMIGERGWTGGRGDFVWTQELVDETIAIYEGILEEIGNGMLYSKTIDGEGELFGVISCNPAAAASTQQEIAGELEATQTLLQEYIPFGLRCETDAAGEIRMEWQGKPVHSVYDAEKGVWVANNMKGRSLGPDAVDLEAVYEQGTLTGLRQTPCPSDAADAPAAEGNAAA